MAVKIRQVLEFYANLEIMEKKEFPITEQYLDKLRKDEWFSLDRRANQKNYIGLALTFMKQNDKSQKVDKCFLEYLQNRDKEGTLFGEKGMKSLSFLEGSFTQDSNFAKRKSFVFLKNISDIYSVELPKWHLFVSWAAGRESGYFSQKGLNLNGAMLFNCSELLLWMCETAASSEVAEKYLTDIESPSWIRKIRKEIREAIEQETIKAKKQYT